MPDDDCFAELNLGYLLTVSSLAELSTVFYSCS